MLGTKKRTRELAIDGVQLTHHRIFEYESLHTGVIHLVHTRKIFRNTNISYPLIHTCVPGA